jgi:hypothetical protein
MISTNVLDILDCSAIAEDQGYVIWHLRCSRCRCLADVPVLYVVPSRPYVKAGYHCLPCIQRMRFFHGHQWTDVLNAFAKAKRILYDRERALERVFGGIRV